YLDITETLNLTNYVAAGTRLNNTIKFSLAGICFHLGETPNSGHITSLVFCDVKKIWYYFNDEEVDKFKSLDDFKRKKKESSHTYMLFYKAIENQLIINTSEDDEELCEIPRNSTKDSLMSIQQTPCNVKRRIYQVVDSSNERIGSSSLNSINLSNNVIKMSDLLENEVILNSPSPLQNNLSQNSFITPSINPKKKTKLTPEEIREKDRYRKRIERSDNQLREIEKAKDIKWHRNARTVEVFRSAERVRDKIWHVQARTDEEFRSDERVRDKNWHVQARTDKEFRSDERVRDKNWHVQARTDEEFRNKDRGWHIEARNDEEFRGSERIRDRDWHIEARTEEEFRGPERIRDRDWHVEARTEEEFRGPERIRDRDWHRIRDRDWHVDARTDEEFRGPERIRDRDWHVEARTDEEFRGPERIRDRDWHVVARTNEEFRDRERENDRINRSARRNNPNFIINSYEFGLKNGPTFICVCCGGLFFRRTCVSFIFDQNNEFLNKKIFNLKFLNSNEPLWICLTLDDDDANFRVSKYANTNPPANPIVNQSDQQTFNNDDLPEETLLIDNDENAMRIAPAEGLSPKSLLTDKDAEELTFLKIYGGQKYLLEKGITYGARC
ncbi:hypothetical protein BpHYR1_004317, partial [Brachionus plicatilis]